MWVCGLTQEAACSGAETVSGWLILKIWKQDRTMWQDLNACNSLKTVFFGMVVKKKFRGGFRPPEPPLRRGDGAFGPRVLEVKCLEQAGTRGVL